MAKQTVTLRLDEDNLTYLAGLEGPGAANLSEKIQSLLADARAQRDGLGDFGAAYDFTRRLFTAPERCVRDSEVRTQVRSELIGACWRGCPTRPRSCSRAPARAPIATQGGRGASPAPGAWTRGARPGARGFDAAARACRIPRLLRPWHTGAAFTVRGHHGRARRPGQRRYSSRGHEGDEEIAMSETLTSRVAASSPVDSTPSSTPSRTRDLKA